MKKLYYIIASILLLAVSCQKPEYIRPTAERQGITSLTAFFTSGKFVDQQISKLVVTDPEADRFEIRIPWFFPEESDHETLRYMTKLRVRAELANNCSISPALTVLDLMQENHFTYTDAQGKSKDIIITGKRVKSNVAEIMSFVLEDNKLEGFIDNDKKEIYLFSLEDLSNSKAKISVSAHASVEDGIAVDEEKNTFTIAARNYNDDQTVTILAHDGTPTEYKITKKIPSKIPFGFNKDSAKQLFNLEPVTRFGAPDYTKNVYLSLGAAEGKLAVCYADGSNPIYLDGQTGVKLGEVNIGSAKVDAITNDGAGNLLFINYLTKQNEDFKIYRSRSVEEAPELLFTVKNPDKLPGGYHFKAIGDVDKNAILNITYEGINGVTVSGSYLQIVIEGGKVKSSQVYNLYPAISWAAAPTNTAKVVSASTIPSDGIFVSWYSKNALTYVKDGKIASQRKPVANANFNSNCLDSKTFNKVNYVVHFVTSHFPMWGAGPQLYIFDVNTPETIGSATPLFSNDKIEWYQKAKAGCAAGDVVMAPSADGFKLFIYYYDHNCGTVGAYSVDCVKK